MPGGIAVGNGAQGVPGCNIDVHGICENETR
jgi:hypothetical protein